MAQETVIRGPLKILGSLPDGTGELVLTIDSNGIVGSALAGGAGNFWALEGTSTLTDATTIDIGDFATQFIGGDASDFRVIMGNTPSTATQWYIGPTSMQFLVGDGSTDGGSLTIDAGQVALLTADVSEGAFVSLVVNLTTVLITSTLASFTGVTYNTDYSANYVDRSIPDWGNVWRGFGTTTLSGDTVISGSGFTNGIEFDGVQYFRLIGGSQLSITSGNSTMSSSATVVSLNNTSTGSGVNISEGRILITPGTSTLATLNVGQRTADPSSFTDGDIWYNSTTDIFYGRANGANVQLSGGGGSIAGLTAGRIPYADSPTSIVDDSALTWDATNNAITIDGIRIHGTANFNTFIGNNSGNFTVTGTQNTTLGDGALPAVTSGQYNTIMGVAAAASLADGDENTVIGRSAMSGGAATSVDHNVMIGSGAGTTTNFAGNRNVMIGVMAGANFSTCDDNILIGYLTGASLTTGDQNVLIGSQVNPQAPTGSGQLSIQNAIFGTGNTATGTTLSSGNIGLYIGTPTARLHLPAGTATANTAPLKLTTGTALGAIEDGALEYHSSHLYFSIGAARYQLDQQTVGSQDLFMSASAMWPRTTNGCAALAKTEMTTSLFNIQSLDFDQTTQEFAQFQIVLPRNWNNGTVTARVYWTAAAGSGTVQWGISGGAYSNDDALTVAFGTAQTVDDTLIATNDLHITDYTSAITLAGSPADADFLAFQISRNPASDTLTGDAKLLGVTITLTTDASVAA